MNNNNLLLNGKIPNLFVKFTIPSIIAMSISGAQSLLDGIFLGRYIGSNALASISIAQPFISSIFGVSLIIAIGSASLIGLEIGKGNIQKAQDTMKTTCIITLLSSLIITLTGILFNKEIASLLGANNILIKDSALYIRNLSLYSLFMCFSLVFGVLTRVIGRSDLAMKANMLSLIVNIVLNTLLVKYLNLGVTGASLSTALAFASSLIILVRPFLDRDCILYIKKGEFNSSYGKISLCNGMSEGISSLSYSITSFMFNNAFMNMAGEGGVSAFTTISYISLFATLTIDGISTGISPIISYNYGANNKHRVRELLKLSCKVTLLFGCFVFLMITLFNKDLVSIFIVDDKNIIEIAASGSKIYAFTFLFNGINILFSSYFTSIGDAFNSSIVAMSRGIVFIFIGILIIPQYLGINGVWATVPFAEFSTLIIIIMLCYIKSRRNLTA